MNKLIFKTALTAAALIFSPSAAQAENTSCPKIGSLKVIGELEHVNFEQAKLRLPARIDTGAKTSSLGIVEHELFERDGQKWIKFSVNSPDKKTPVVMEHPIKRVAKIKRHGAEAQERPVVVLNIKIHGETLKREFNLTDRSHYEYPILIGRNILQGRFIVDVNRKFSASQTKEAE